jgi:hypothetical protein
MVYPSNAGPGQPLVVPFAVLQHRLEIPDPAAVTRACRGVEGLHPSDAPNLAGDAFGILVKGLSETAASQFVAGLAREGIDAELADEASLPALPPGKKLRRAECRPEGFVAFDPYDRELLIPWDRVAVVSAGEVRLVQFKPVTLITERTYQNPNWKPSNQSTLTVSSEERNWCWTADVLLAGGELRFSFQCGEFTPEGLGDRVTRGQTANFLTFLRDLLAFVPEATRNRGAFAVGTGDPADTGPRYPTRNAYQEELVWLLWRLRRAGRPV